MVSHHYQSYHVFPRFTLSLRNLLKSLSTYVMLHFHLFCNQELIFTLVHYTLFCKNYEANDTDELIGQPFTCFHAKLTNDNSCTSETTGHSLISRH